LNDEHYYQRLAAAYVRGRLALEVSTSLEDLSAVQLDFIFACARESELRLHRFKRTAQLARVRKVLGTLRGLAPSELLDLGTGRGAFLWPLLEEMPDLPVTCLDRLDYRVEDICAVARGGISRLEAQQGDVTALPFADRSFDGVTMLEVLEHIPDTQLALAEVSRVARRFLLLTVPSKEDSNPEHIHRFRALQLVEWLTGLGWPRVSHDGVLNHLFVCAVR
jgi:ubiquinone/menaquinone biosynthesis C-methylase UbiE